MLLTLCRSASGGSNGGGEPGGGLEIFVDQHDPSGLVLLPEERHHDVSSLQFHPVERNLHY